MIHFSGIVPYRGETASSKGAADKNTGLEAVTGERKMRERNPYLVDYEEQRRLKNSSGRRTTGKQGRGTAMPYVQRQSGGQKGRLAEAGMDRRIYHAPEYTQEDNDRTLRMRREERARRRRRMVRRQRMAVGLWVLAVFAVLLALGISRNAASASAGKESDSLKKGYLEDALKTLKQESLVQGLPESVYNAHPAWTEDFLTSNEYSRPGDKLEEIKNIFVHYTANPGTSAAQNRSYFEQQKDTHERSVSAHFIIGYDGEILQCIPLDEIAYAVMTRNMDSVSIECCYKAEDGSFTQETYDSLIRLLSWLTYAYGLDEEDILRHYDCGGKKCPLYYTENPDAWERLKEDVARQSEKSSL